MKYNNKILKYFFLWVDMKICKMNKIIWSFRIFLEYLFSIILRLKSAIDNAFNFSKNSFYYQNQMKDSKW